MSMMMTKHDDDEDDDDDENDSTSQEFRTVYKASDRSLRTGLQQYRE